MRELPFSLLYLKFNFVLIVMRSTSLVVPQEFRIAVMDDSIMIFKASRRLTRERRSPQAMCAPYLYDYSLMSRKTGRKR